MNSKNFTFSAALVAAFIGTVSTLAASSVQAEAVDASDPTKIYTFAGGGAKYNDYTNGDHMLEARATGNIGFGKKDSLLFEFGYGWSDSDQAAGDNSDFTNARLRWFHLYDIDYEIERGYRGNGLQVDLQLAGRLIGTDGQNQLLVGMMPVYALSTRWNLYLMANVANTWDKHFEYWNGIGPSVTTQFIYDNESFWSGMQLRISPGYTYFIAGDLEDEGSGILEVNLGGQISPTVMWDLVLEKNFDKDLKSYRREESSELKNDWNIYFNVTSYF